MRRVTGFVLIGLGAFLLAAGLLARFYVLDQILVIPLDKAHDTVAPGTGTYFDPQTLTEKQSDLVALRRVKPDPQASNETTGVWDVGLTIETGDGTFVRASQDRVAFDRKTAQSVHCCGEAVDSQPTTHDGVTYQFPFDTGKQTYQFWDVASKKAYPAQYVTEEKVQDLTTYKFLEDIPVQQLGTQEVPGTLVGESAASFQAPIVYSNVRTVWVEPRTGVIVKGSEQTKTTLQNAAGEDKVTVLDVTFTFDDATQRSQAKLASDAISLINLVQWILPAAALIVGLSFIAVGVLLSRGSRRPEAGDGDRVAQLVPSGGPSEQAVPEDADTERFGPPGRAGDRGPADSLTRTADPDR